MGNLALVAIFAMILRLAIVGLKHAGYQREAQYLGFGVLGVVIVAIGLYFASELQQSEEMQDSALGLYVQFGNYDREAGNYDLAISRYNDALLKDRNYGNAYRNRAVAYAGKGDYEQALTDANYALDLYTGQSLSLAEPYTSRGEVYHLMGQADEALADVNRALEIDPNLAEAYKVRGDVYDRLERYADALADYERYIELTADKPNAAVVARIEELKALVD